MSSQLQYLFDKRQGQKPRRKAWLLTLVLVLIFLLLFTFFGLPYQVPPPAEMGHFVILGPETESIGMQAAKKGTAEQEKEKIEESPEEPTEPVEEPTPPETNTPPLTDPEAAAPEETPEESTPEDNATSDPETTNEPPQEKEEKGTEEGSDDGEDIAGDYFKNRKNSGGKEDGKDDGQDSDGLSYSMKTGFGNVGLIGKGPKPIDIPNIDEKIQENADVYVKVFVNEDGSVFDAVIDYNYTTTANKSLEDKAIRSAKNAKFEKGSPGSGQTVVTIKYEYRVKGQ